MFSVLVDTDLTSCRDHLVCPLHGHAVELIRWAAVSVSCTA